MDAGASNPDVTVLAPSAAAPDPYADLNDTVAQSTTAAVSCAGVLATRADFESIGGFAEGILAGAEYDLGMRLRELGRDIDLPPLPSGPAGVWLRRRYGGARSRWSLRGLWHRLAGDNRTAARRERPTRASDPERSLVLMTDAFPARSETFVQSEIAAMRELGWRVRVESSARPARIDREALRWGRVDYLEDEPPLAAARDLAWLAARHPWRCLHDLFARRRFAAEEEPWPLRALAPAARRLASGGERHIHVHFAAGAALHAMRLARILGIKWSLAAHGYDVFAQPRNLRAKLGAASLVAAPCEYTATFLRDQLEDPDRVHVVVMGVDAERFRSRRSHPHGRTAVAIGRLVEKKGFRHLVEAARLLELEQPLDRLLIAGDGPLRDELEAAIRASGLQHRVEIVSAWGADEIRELLERADVLAVPSVVAADGDRDAMPVVAKEALAMEVPVVASDEVGLPELIEPGWGKLVPPGDADALAAALADVLALPAAERAAMGTRGREHVIRTCDVHTETAKLARLIEAARAAPGA